MCEYILKGRELGKRAKYRRKEWRKTGKKKVKKWWRKIDTRKQMRKPGTRDATVSYLSTYTLPVDTWEYLTPEAHHFARHTWPGSFPLPVTFDLTLRGGKGGRKGRGRKATGVNWGLCRWGINDNLAVVVTGISFFLTCPPLPPPFLFLLFVFRPFLFLLFVFLPFLSFSPLFISLLPCFNVTWNIFLLPVHFPVREFWRSREFYEVSEDQRDLQLWGE